MPDDQNQPTESELDALATFAGTPEAFIALLEPLFAYCGSVLLTVDEVNTRLRVRTTTGGWSGHEQVNEILNTTMFHHLWWHASYRGGKTVYHVPLSWLGTELLLGDPTRTEVPA